MVKVKLLVSRSGPDTADNAGDEIEVDAAEAKRMIAAGQAVGTVERATKRPAKVERATK